MNLRRSQVAFIVVVAIEGNDIYMYSASWGRDRDAFHSTTATVGWNKIHSLKEELLERMQSRCGRYY